MATYLVQRRMNLGLDIPAGVLVVNPPDAALLLSRGYIMPVADDFPGEPFAIPSEASAGGHVPAEVSPTDSTEPATEPAKVGQLELPSLPRVIDLSGVEASSLLPEPVEV